MKNIITTIQQIILLFALVAILYSILINNVVCAVLAVGFLAGIVVNNLLQNIAKKWK